MQVIDQTKCKSKTKQNSSSRPKNASHRPKNMQVTDPKKCKTSTKKFIAQKVQIIDKKKIQIINQRMKIIDQKCQLLTKTQVIDKTKQPSTIFCPIYCSIEEINEKSIDAYISVPNNYPTVTKSLLKSLIQ